MFGKCQVGPRCSTSPLLPSSSTLVQVMFGFGLPVAWQNNCIFDPSRTIWSAHTLVRLAGTDKSIHMHSKALFLHLLYLESRSSVWSFKHSGYCKDIFLFFSQTTSTVRNISLFYFTCATILGFHVKLKKKTLKLSFHFHQVNVTSKHISAGLFSTRLTALVWKLNTEFFTWKIFIFNL